VNQTYLQHADALLQHYRQQGADAKLLDTLGEARDILVAEDNIEPALVHLLPTTLRTTRSEFGFLAEVAFNSAGDPYLKSHAVTDIYKPGFGLYDIVSGLQFYNLDTLNGAIMTERRPVLSNDPDSDPRSGGLPFGHTHLTAFLGLPFLLDGDIVGATALANRLDGYSQRDIDLLQPLCEIGALLIAAYR